MPTPNMALTIPTVSVTAGPTYATQINAAMDLIDAHDHTSGKGVRVPSAGLNINADLPFGGNDATGVRTIAYSSQGAPLSSSDTNAVYVSGGNLYFNNGSGVAVKITDGSALNAAAAGGIGGDYPTSTASVSYSTATKTFTFTQSANTSALIDVGSVIIRKLTASSPGITLVPDAALASGYTLTLPAAPPGSTLPVSMSSSGALSAAQITTAQIDTNAIPTKVWVNILTDGAGNAAVESGGSGVTGTPTITGTGNSVLRFQFTTPFAARCVLIATVNGVTTAGSPNGRIAQTIDTGDGWTTHGQVNIRDDAGTNIDLTATAVRVSIIALGNV